MQLVPHEPLLGIPFDPDLPPQSPGEPGHRFALVLDAPPPAHLHVLGALEVEHVEEEVAHGEGFGPVGGLQTLVEDLVADAVGLGVGVVVGDAVLRVEALHFDRAMVVGPATLVQGEITAQIAVIAGDVVVAAPFGA